MQGSLVVPVSGSKNKYNRMVASTTRSEDPHLVCTPVKFSGQFKGTL